MLTASARASSRRRYSAAAALGDITADADGMLRLRIGDKAPEVEDWQANLYRLGFDVGVTGTFDDATLRATMQVQAAHGLKQTGVVDDATRGVMADDLDKMEPPKTGNVPLVNVDPLKVSGRFPSWLWLLLPVAAGLAWKKKRK